MFVGREAERALLRNALRDDRSHFIAVYGRRRIGKTYLVRDAFDGHFTFQHAGLYKGKAKEQLFAFSASLKDAGYKEKTSFGSWLEAFEGLKDLIRSSTEKKKVIFIDELSWMDTRGSDLLMALESFWNGWASARKDIVLIVCSSATSWILSNVVHNKGGLYNRLTEQIRLTEFSLAECEKYTREAGLLLNRDQILQYYMVFGGVPYYWDFLQKGLSIPQNIDSILFAEDAPLKQEFDYLYASIYNRPEEYLKIVEALAARKAGMTREEIITHSGIGNTGNLSRKLEELEYCGFIRKYESFGSKKKNALYQLIDHFTLFYYQFLGKGVSDPHYWTNQINNPRVNTWKGLAFERVCLRHIPEIKEKLGISGVLTQVNSWSCKADPDKGLFGSQIDLLIVRKDQIIDLCEMKYADSGYLINEKTDQSLRCKISDLQRSIPAKYTIHPILVTCYGLVENTYSQNVQAVITLDDLFRERR